MACRIFILLDQRVVGSGYLSTIFLSTLRFDDFYGLFKKLFAAKE